MSARHALIQFLFSQFYEVKPTQPRSKCRSSYGMKHEFEKALFHGWEGRFYFSNTETKEALAHIPHFTEEPNHFYRVKPKFPIRWISHNHPLTNRPYGERKVAYEAYLHARNQINMFLLSLPLATGDTETSYYSRVIALVGHVGEVKAVPGFLRAEDYTQQQINELQEDIYHAWEGREEEWAARHGSTEPQETGDPVSPSAPATVSA